MTDDTIGVDISKATLDIHRLSDGKVMSFSNCPAGFTALSKFCAKTAVVRVVYEATGAYHSGLERALGAHLPLVKGSARAALPTHPRHDLPRSAGGGSRVGQSYIPCGSEKPAGACSAVRRNLWGTSSRNWSLEPFRDQSRGRAGLGYPAPVASFSPAACRHLLPDLQ